MKLLLLIIRILVSLKFWIFTLIALKIFKKMVPEMPVIMLTGHGSERAAREGIEEGAFDYLTKPYNLEGLIEKIKEAISRRG